MLTTVLEQPFELINLTPTEPVIEQHVSKWYRHLVKESPLWCWQPRAFAKLHDSNLPSTYPLEAFVESILHDENISETGQSWLSSLEGEIDRRRHRIANTGTPVQLSVALTVDDFPPKLPNRPQQFLHANDLVTYKPDGLIESAVARVSPYERIGRQLVRLLEAKKSALAAEDGEMISKAEQELKEFLNGIEIGTAGPPSKGPLPEQVKLLYQEAATFLSVCWKALLDSPAPSERAQSILKQSGADNEDAWLWSARLAIPILSKPEVQALMEQMKMSTESSTTERPTPKRFSIWLISHRLSMDPRSVARKASGPSMATYFKQRDNPIAKFIAR